MSDYYTRTGDDGFTGLLGEGRVPKNHPITEAVGAIDEATAAIGLARAHASDEDTTTILLQVQRDLYHLMAEVVARPENAARFRKIDEQTIGWLEERIDAVGHRVEMPGDFILPGDTLSGAMLALARTIVRRAERNVVGLYHQGTLENPSLLHYLNRLSSLLFLLELLEYHLSSSGSTLAKES